MNKVLKLASLLAGLALSACVSSPEAVVVSSGTLPRAGTYGVIEASSALELATLVSKHLEEKGLRAAHEPRYLVQIGSSARPAAVGLFVPDTNEEQWHRSPAGARRETIRSVIVSLTDKDTGREVYRITAEEASRESTSPDDLPRLLTAALGSPPDAQDPAEHP